MEDRVAAGDRRLDRAGVEQVGLDQLDLVADPEQVEAREARAAEIGQVRSPAIEDANRGSPAQQRARQVRSDEAVAAGNQRPRRNRRFQPPATAGRMVTSSPSSIPVSRPCWKRMSSPET
jgi:hypothetical protein